MKRRIFIKQAGIIGSASMLSSNLAHAIAPDFKVVRVAPSKRHFKSNAVESAITEFSKNVKNKELAWLFNNCFPNTLDTTVTYSNNAGRPDTYVITGDIDAMWLRDSTAQVWPYLPFMSKDTKLKDLIAGVINRQVKCILKDPYANAFYGDDNKVGEWAHDLTKMQPGLHERKWEIDSLCYPVRLAYHYWKNTGDTKPFDNNWQQAVKAILKTFKEQQRKENDGPYSFQRRTAWATDGVPMEGFGYPVKPVGLICSSFRPSDDATVFSFLIPSNFFAVTSLKQASEMMAVVAKDQATSKELSDLAIEVENALKEHAIVTHPKYGKVYAYEVNGFGSYNLMDDANIPSLLAMPYLGSVDVNDSIYQNTRKLLLSTDNPFYYKGTAAEGIGGPHIGKNMIWPMSIIARGLTSSNDEEIRYCIKTLQNTHAGTGFMHESFHKDNPEKFTRSWFAWTNTIFGEFLWKTYQTKPNLLS
ncbi:glycoside hydrolase family 125 protein [Mucilaginibacter aquatilis]|uniref:Metal-independent alpha-mannosidase n=1 Tax=Mucilaginibacter aquatilis TaxID=1517760 RepID=A0A6I4IHI7_9SPHI|nr:glycoside hydrolase family 125 protein [Mucilaginibacter aquatilis]MVN92829.1 metal-independent alpha-mannosidase [Mucilaginibacter aquatilis]